VDSKSSDKRIGTRIGRYAVESVIGAGGMANVYAATDDTGAWCALKILHRPLSMDEVAVARFFEEAYLVNSVKHPGVCRIVDDGVSEDKCPYLVMDLLQGETLDALLEAQKSLPVAEALALGIDIADTLTSVHGAGIIHRDLKPANLFVTFAGAVKVLDFGVGKGKNLAMKTLEGVLLGTPAFMSPEQAIGSGSDKIDARADVFSLGAVVFRMIAGENVHTATDSYSRWFAAATEHPRSLATAAPGAPPKVVEVIDRALAFDREERWPSASAFLVALREARASLGTSPSTTPLASTGGRDGSFFSMLAELRDVDKP